MRPWIQPLLGAVIVGLLVAVTAVGPVALGPPRSLGGPLGPLSLPPPGSSPAPSTPTPTQNSTAAALVSACNESLKAAAHVSNIEQIFGLNESAREHLARDCLVVLRMGNWSHEFVGAYKALRGAGLPLLVTTDSVLHAFHVAFDKVLQELEGGAFIADLTALAGAMMNASLEQAGNVDPALTAVALRNAGYFAVALKLLDPNATIPDAIADVTTAEVQLITAHAGFATSPLFSGEPRSSVLHFEDYSQYLPRGHYTVNASMERYFRAAMWFGRVGFIASDEGELRGAALVGALWNSAAPELLARWERVYNITSFFVGPSDDLLPRDFAGAARAVIGNMSASAAELLNAKTLADLKAYVDGLPDPRIVSGLVTDQQDPVQVTKGMRFMGQRAVIDSEVFQLLVYNKVGAYTGSGEPFTMVDAPGGGKIRGFPRGLDVASALGSDVAAGIIRAEGDADYVGFVGNAAQARGLFANLTDAGWNSTLYLGWLNSLRAGIEPANDSGHPQFMRSDAYAGKSLNTALGSWTALRRDTILYAKQSYTSFLTGAPPQPPTPPEVYVEPAPDLYARLSGLAERMRSGLWGAGALTPGWNVTLGWQSEMAGELAEISKAQLNGTALTDDQTRFLSRFPDNLDAAMGGADDKSRDTRLVADVHTDPNSGQVLEEGVGSLSLMVVLVQHPDGSWSALPGPVFSYFEFKRPMEGRLTDEAWRAMLPDGAPPQAPWQDQFAV